MERRKQGIIKLLMVLQANVHVGSRFFFKDLKGWVFRRGNLDVD